MEHIVQIIFWILAGLWWIGVRFPYIEVVIGICALLIGLLLLI